MSDAAAAVAALDQTYAELVSAQQDWFAANQALTQANDARGQANAALQAAEQALNQNLAAQEAIRLQIADLQSQGNQLSLAEQPLRAGVVNANQFLGWKDADVATATQAVAGHQATLDQIGARVAAAKQAVIAELNSDYPPA